MDILITICARGGSKGIPGKNIKNLNGKPLIAYTIEHATSFSLKYNCDIGLSTDDEKIREIASEYGVHTSYLRNSDLAKDNSGKVPVIDALLKYHEETRSKKYDFILDLDVSAPMRTIDDLISAFDILQKDSNALNIFSVGLAEKNPYFNMVEESADNGYFKVCKKLHDGINSRQEAPKVYAMNASFYFYRKAFFDAGLIGAITERSLIFEMEHECFDLDQPRDFEYLDYLITNKKLDFNML